jgi:2'-5' RNA ligase
MMEKRTRKLSSQQLYFIAIVPPQSIYDEALSLKNYFHEKYSSRASLDSPPHITLHMPFKWKESNENELISGLESFALKLSSFELKFNGFNCFKPRVIYIDVAENKELLDLQKALSNFCKVGFNLFNANHRDNPYHPHLTLAFRDLSKSNFTKAWEEFSSKPFEGAWKVEALVLLKHNGKMWNPFKEFRFDR